MHHCVYQLHGQQFFVGFAVHGMSTQERVNNHGAGIPVVLSAPLLRDKIGMIKGVDGTQVAQAIVKDVFMAERAKISEVHVDKTWEALDHRSIKGYCTCGSC